MLKEEKTLGLCVYVYHILSNFVGTKEGTIKLFNI